MSFYEHKYVTISINYSFSYLDLGKIGDPDGRVLIDMVARLCSRIIKLFIDENDAKCKELGWICVPMEVEAYGAWGTEAMESFSLLASQLATSSNRAKAEVLAALYGRLNLNLVRANATAILSRCFVPDY